MVNKKGVKNVTITLEDLANSYSDWVSDNFDEIDELKMFLDALFGRKRLLILKRESDFNKLYKQLEEYCNKNSIQYSKPNFNRNITAEQIRGEVVVDFENGQPSHHRNLPGYIAFDKRQMIVIDGLSADTDLEVLRAFCYMGCLGGYYNDLENLPKDKLPVGSSYVFIAKEDFPIEKFMSITTHFREESSEIDLNDFEKKVKKHMELYKQNVLKIADPGVYIHNGNEHKMHHILPVKLSDLNILNPYNTDTGLMQYFDFNKKHRYFHHLNSSQAMCINFFFPLIKYRKLDVVLKMLNIEGEPAYNTVKFEKESDLEKGKYRKTNFDFYFETTEGKKIYFEIKYTENGFGAYSFGLNGNEESDREHDETFLNTYQMIFDNNPAIEERFKQKEVFFKHYQLMRNLLHIDNDSYVIFLYPEGNKAVRSAARNAKEEVIKPQWRRQFKPVTWESLIKAIDIFINQDDLLDYYKNSFRVKYLNY